MTMALVRWEPFRELTALQNEMGRWMSQLAGATSGPGDGQSSPGWLPAVDVWETENELVLSFDLPGVSEDKVSVEVEDGTLTVSGERERTHEQTDERFYRYERRFGSFARSVSLPVGIDEDRIAASVKDGVLEVRVPKPETQKPRRIQVGVESKDAIEGTATRDG
jgi:HSP20 family protein